MQIALLYLSNTPLIVICYANDFLLMLMINHWARLKVSLVAIVHPLMLLSTYANSVIKSSFALMRFMEVLMNLYWLYSFNC